MLIDQLTTFFSAEILPYLGTYLGTHRSLDAPRSRRYSVHVLVTAPPESLLPGLPCGKVENRKIENGDLSGSFLIIFLPSFYYSWLSCLFA